MNPSFRGRKLFLDATVLISGTTLVDTASYALYTCGSDQLYSNEYCVMETRHYFQDKKNCPPHETNGVIDSIRRRVRILPTAPVKEYQKLDLPDKLKSDKPVVKGALDVNAVLVTHDWALLREARKYVETASPAEILQK